MKAAVIIFHKNVKMYNADWIKKCIDSIKNQTYKAFDVFEMDYGGTFTQIYEGSSFASSAHCATHADAHNFLLDKVFELGYDCAFNVNVDDIYSLDRFEKQMPYIEEGYDIVSSNFHHIDDRGRILYPMIFDSKDPHREAIRGHNIIAHPVVCYSKNFWITCTKLRSNEIPKDDFELWKRSYGKYKFKILSDFLLYYRVHSLKVSAPKHETNKIRRGRNS
ncbi:MAG: hypothetical protein ACHQ1D_00235 [Nitrososphaerales archaeon]